MKDVLSSVITGVFGFIGVLAGLGWNWVQMPRIEERLRQSTRNALRTSLWAELTALERLMRDEYDYVRNNDFTWVPLVDSFKMYLSNIQNLGLLTPAEAQKITIAYYQYQESAGYLALIAEDHPEKPAIGRHIKFDFKEAKPRTRQDVLNALKDIASKSHDAVLELEAQLKSTTNWLKPPDQKNSATPAS
jgi:hypothetical protein